MNPVTYFENIIKDLNSKPYYVLEKSPAVFYLIAKEEGIVSGINEVEMFLNLYDIELSFRKHKESGQVMKRGDIVCSISGPKSSLYHALDTVSFILGKMSGIASIASFYRKKLTHSSLINMGESRAVESIFYKEALKDGGAVELPFALVDETMIDLYGSYEDAIAKTRISFNNPIALEVNDISKFYDALKTDADILVLKYFNDEAIRRAIIDNKGQKRLMVGGLILPNRLDIIGSYQFDYLTTSLIYTAARIYEFAVKVG